MAPKFKPNVFATVNPDETTLDRDGFHGVDPIYQNYANDTDAPIGDPDHKDKKRGSDEGDKANTTQAKEGTPVVPSETDDEAARAAAAKAEEEAAAEEKARAAAPKAPGTTTKK